MSAVADALAPPTREVARIWAWHLLTLVFPLNALTFLATGPHGAGVALLFVLPLVAAHAADRRSPPERREPDPALPAWPFDALLFVLFGLQLVNVLLLARLFAVQSFWSVDTLVAIIVVGANSGYSAIVVAHELIHRRSRGLQLMGRILLCSVVYEHFYTEHLRGHHVRVGTPDDPATARFGESFARFYFRTVPAQFRSAWRLDRRRVIQGLIAEWTLAFAIAISCGAGAFAVFLLQAWFASRALEVVNYFEHWGLERRGRRVAPEDSWDTHSWFTYYGLTGLTRHADHHAWPSRPYQQLRVCEESPILPRGYIALFPLVLARNREFQRLMTEELQRRRLGPFAEAQPDAATA